MARPTLSNLIAAINAIVVENTQGNITATQMNQLLQNLTNGLYLPTQPTITVNTQTGIYNLTFGGGLTVTLDPVNGTATVNSPEAPTPPTYGEMNITNATGNTVVIGGGKTTGADLLPITAGTTYFQVPGYAAGKQQGLVYDATAGGLRATVAGDYKFTGWLSVSSSATNTTSAVVFGIKRGGSIIATSPRPTPTWLPNASRLGLISGVGLVTLAIDDVVVPLIGADTACTLTINNSTLIGELLKVAGA